jgi:long-chain fatty acid transport protein
MRQSCVVVLCGGLAALTAGEASAGGLADREQSTTFQGTSFAGDAAGGALSSTFWIPAALSESGTPVRGSRCYGQR